MAREKFRNARIDTAQVGERRVREAGARPRRGNDGQAVGALLPGGVLGGGLVAGDADRTLHAGTVEDGALDRERDVARRTPQLPAAADIEEGFVDRIDFDFRGKTGEGAHDVGGNPRVTQRAAVGANQLRAEPAPFVDVHSGANPVRARLVGAGNDAGAAFAVGERERTAAPLRAVHLLDRREESVHVGEQDDARPALREIVAHE